MNVENKIVKPRKPRGKSDRINIEPKNLEKVDQTLRDLTKIQPGLQISRKDFINWLIETQHPKLTETETKQLISLYYDEEKFVRFALEEIRAAKLRGEKVTLNDLLSRQVKISEPRKRRQRQGSPTPSETPCEGKNSNQS